MQLLVMLALLTGLAVACARFSADSRDLRVGQRFGSWVVMWSPRLREVATNSTVGSAGDYNAPPRPERCLPEVAAGRVDAPGWLTRRVRHGSDHR